MSPQRGAATLLVVTLCGLLLTLGLALGGAGSAVVGHRRAQAAADLAALAAAGEAVDGGDGCAVAATVAEQNGARLSRCTTAGREVVVIVVVTATVWRGWSADLTAQARAGPAP